MCFEKNMEKLVPLERIPHSSEDIKIRIGTLQVFCFQSIEEVGAGLMI